MEFNGLKILGIPHSCTHDIKNVRKIKEDFPDSFEIVLAHPENKRRIWLFELDTRYIIAGHFDERLCKIKDKIFISISSYLKTSVLIETKKGKITYKRTTTDSRVKKIFTKLKWN